MDRAAIFVDAGYLFAQGSTAMAGAKQPRSLIDLDEQSVIAELKAVSTRLSDLPLLRIYWYDGALLHRGPTTEHARLGQSHDVKLRLGFLNSAGQQKGVDALIVTDLIDLARNRAMADAILLSGDEDVRIGVQVAQSYGVRVHLLGIEPSRGSQSPQLSHEADTTTEWNAATVAKFLSIRTPSAPSLGIAAAAHPSSTPVTGGASSALPFDAIVDDLVDKLEVRDLIGISAFWNGGQRGVPAEFDGKLLACCRAAMGQDLDPSQKRYVRGRFSQRVRDRQTATASAVAGSPEIDS